VSRAASILTRSGRSITTTTAFLTHRERFVTLKRRARLRRICSISLELRLARRARLKRRHVRGTGATTESNE